MRTLKISCLLIVALLMFSFIGGFSDSQVERHQVMHLVVAGDTLYGIADKYYVLNENDICFNEFWYNLCQDNKYLTANRRRLQIGDVVTVNYYTVTKN